MPLLIIRHGERMDYAVKGWLAQAERPWDPPLTGTGREQARAAGHAANQMLEAHQMAPVSRIFSSPLARCVDTSAQLVDTTISAEAKIAVEPSLVETLCREWYHSWGVPGASGEWGGPPDCRTGADVSPEQLHPATRVPAGQLFLSPEDLCTAFGPVIDTSYQPLLPYSALGQVWGQEEGRHETQRLLAFAEHCEESYPGETVVLCTHGGPATHLYRGLCQDSSSEVMCGYTGIFLLQKGTEGWQALVTADTTHLGDTKELGFATAAQ